MVIQTEILKKLLRNDFDIMSQKKRKKKKRLFCIHYGLVVNSMVPLTKMDQTAHTCQNTNFNTIITIKLWELGIRKLNKNVF